jgi:hypothetical protein
MCLARLSPNPDPGATTAISAANVPQETANNNIKMANLFIGAKLYR